jgi:hypothetical protein
VRASSSRQAQSALVQNFSREAFLFAQQPQQQVLGTDVLVREPLSFLRGIGEHTLTLVA